MKHFKQWLFETYDKNLSELIKYINMSEDERLEKTIDWIQTHIHKSKQLQSILKKHVSDNSTINQLIKKSDFNAVFSVLKIKFHETLFSFGLEVKSQLYEKSLTDIEPLDYPAFSFFSNHSKLLKNRWLIHFTNYAVDIANRGFTYATANIEHLGITTEIEYDEKDRIGYNFAFDALSELNPSEIEFKYGCEAVLFQATGVETFHYEDEENQVIFWNEFVKNIVPIVRNKTQRNAHEEFVHYEWIIISNKNKIIFKSTDLKTVVEWVINNFPQYKKSLLRDKIKLSPYSLNFSN